MAADTLVTDSPPEDMTLLRSDQGVLPVHYRRGIIGKRDKAMKPMILAGSIFLIAHSCAPLQREDPGLSFEARGKDTQSVIQDEEGCYIFVGLNVH